MKRIKQTRIKDTQVSEFLRKDLGEDLSRSGSGILLSPKSKQKLTSIFIDPALVDKLKQKAMKRGLGYQTMLKTIVYEHIDEY